MWNQFGKNHPSHQAPATAALAIGTKPVLGKDHDVCNFRRSPVSLQMRKIAHSTTIFKPDNWLKQGGGADPWKGGEFIGAGPQPEEEPRR